MNSLFNGLAIEYLNGKKIIRYAALKENDIVNGENICVSFWTQGCPFHCPGCHNPETWNFNGGIEESFQEVLDKILTAIPKNGVQRNFSVLGGEPLCNENIRYVWEILYFVKKYFPNIKIFLWTGYTKEEIFSFSVKKKIFNSLTYEGWYEDWLRINIIRFIDVIITGRYEQDKRDITLKLKGSTNQEILYKNIDY